MAGATATLRSQDCLRRHHPSSTFHFKNTNFTPHRRLKSNARDGHHLTVPVSSSPIINNLGVGQVRILKRGEPLPENTPSEKTKNIKTTAFVSGRCKKDEDDLVLCSTGRLGPDPETLLKEIKLPDLFAGVGMFTESPSPSSVPFPAFFTKKEKKNNAATTDLRRLLKLDMAAS